jgi:hypothetical protein
MRLLAIESANFGALALREPIVFAPGINVIVASNQAGKTTLLTLIEWALYGVPPHTSAKRSAVALEDWAPWSGEKPRGLLQIAPELQGWPGQLRLDANFADYRAYLTDTQSLADVSRFIQVSKNGTWDLGVHLLGLRREAFKASLLALQGELEQVLTDIELRKVLTADLAELVEDPDRATLDAALEALEKPSFSFEPLQSTPIQLHNLLSRAEEEHRRKRQQREALETKYRELEHALSEREEAEHQLSALSSEFAQSEVKREQYDLATAHWRYSQVHKLREGLREWDKRLADTPLLANFPHDLDGAIQRWRGEVSQYRDAVNRHHAKLDQHRLRHAAVDEQLRRDEALAALADYLPQLGELNTALDLGQKEVNTAEWKVKEYGEGSDVLTRSRFEALDERIAPHRDAVPALMEWIETQSRLGAERAQLEKRIKELEPSVRRTSPVMLYLAAALLVGAVAAGVIGPLLHAAPLGVALAVVLAAGALALLALGLRGRQAADKAIIEISQVLKPGLEKLTQQEKSLGYQHVELQAQYNLSDELWQQMLRDLPEYSQLNMKLRNYADACRDRDHARDKVESAWGSVRYILADAPPKADRDWLTATMGRIEQTRRRQQERLDLVAAIKDGERELNNLQRKEQEELLPRLGKLLEPLGLEQRALADAESAIRQYESLARDARAYADQLALLATAEDRARTIPLPREEYERRIGLLSPLQIQQIGRMVRDEEGFRRAGIERRAIHERAVELRQKLDQAQAAAGRFRERIARDEDALLRVPDAQSDDDAAAARLATVQRWERALELLRHLLRGLQRELASSLAPHISEELGHILRQAPVPNIEAVALGEQLDLRLRVAGAPPGLTPQEAVGRLSLGAKRQLAVALRAAVAHALGATRNAPLMLDEPLAELDDERAVDCLRYLEQLGTEHQVLLTTCHAAQLKWLLERSGIKATVLALP